MSASTAPLGALLATISLPDWRAHPWRHGVALLAVALGVALAFSVHLVNASALAEFASAVRVAQGRPDLSLRCTQPAGCDDEALEALAAQPAVQHALPLLDVDALALPAAPGAPRVALRVIGLDALVVAAIAPEWLPQPAAGASRTAALDPELVFLNAAALARLKLAVGDTLTLQQGLAGGRALRIAGTVAAGGPPLAVIDIAGAQAHFDRIGRLSRLLLRLAPGADAASLAPPAGWQPVQPDDEAQRVSNVSRAYRVNLTVLALVALFVGAFLVFSVIALSVAQRAPAFALLGVLGLSAAERRRVVLAESALAGAAGSVLGLALGTALAALALRWLAGDLGGGYFPGIAPQLQFSWTAAFVFGALGVAAALVAGWLPAKQAETLAPAQALKGLGGAAAASLPRWVAPLLLAAGALLALLPPVSGLPLAAYAAVAVLLLGGVALVPMVVRVLLALPLPRRSPLLLLALTRAHHEHQAATVAVAGVVASLALAVALTVMVASFRDGVARWLDDVLPADLYLRSAPGAATSDAAYLTPEFIAALSRIDGVARIEASRVRALALDPARPAVSLIARPLPDPARQLPLVDAPQPAQPGEVAVYVSEAMVALYGSAPGDRLLLRGIGEVRVRGVWRDYARQFGSVVIDLEAYRRLTGDRRLNDLALWLDAGAAPSAVQRSAETLAPPGTVEFAQTAQLRAWSLQIFDRSFAVTYYLQALAVAIGLFGIAASFSAQALARRREFGLLAHLGLTRAQMVGVVAGEGFMWSVIGALLGLALGLAVSVVLVFVVNPQSFHWTMDLVLPGWRLAALCGAVAVAGSAAAGAGARAAASVNSVRAVKEDW
jgi:putative ABC transport system permease protein